MRERLALLGGRCTVESDLGVGTRIVAEVPLVPTVERLAMRNVQGPGGPGS